MRFAMPLPAAATTSEKAMHAAYPHRASVRSSKLLLTGTLQCCFLELLIPSEPLQFLSCHFVRWATEQFGILWAVEQAEASRLNLL